MSKQKKGGIVSTVLMWFFIIVFLISLFVVINELVIKPRKNSDTLSKAQEIRDNSYDYLSNLKIINPDIVSWINIPGTVIDYPVVHPTEEEGYDYYLTHDYKKNYTIYGSIFVDLECGVGDECLKAKNIILHGHNMKNGSMFAQILKYSDVEFYKSSPILTFDNSQWEIFAAIKVNVLESQGEPFKYLQYSFSSDNDFLNFVHQVRSRSLIDTPVKINENDQIMTMSTCSYEYKDFRTALYARRVRDGEESNIDVSQAKLSASPLWPDCYYEDHNVVKPSVKDFNTDLNSGKINWYDGNISTNNSEKNQKKSVKNLK